MKLVVIDRHKNCEIYFVKSFYKERTKIDMFATFEYLETLEDTYF